MRFAALAAFATALAVQGGPLTFDRVNSRSDEEPVFTPSVDVMLWKDDFNRMQHDSDIVRSYVTLAAEAMHVEPGAGLNGSTALRFDWRASRACRDEGRVLEHSFPSSAEVVVQYSVRYSPGFVFDWGRRGPCTGNAKKLFFLWAAAGSRFDFISENHKLGMGSDNDHPLFGQNVNGGPSVTPESISDGIWHRVTIRVQQSSAPGTRDGSIYGWIDGVLDWKYDHVASNASGGWVLFKMPATFNQGSPADQSEWVDDLSIWRP